MSKGRLVEVRISLPVVFYTLQKSLALISSLHIWMKSEINLMPRAATSFTTRSDLADSENFLYPENLPHMWTGVCNHSCGSSSPSFDASHHGRPDTPVSGRLADPSFLQVRSLVGEGPCSVPFQPTQTATYLGMVIVSPSLRAFPSPEREFQPSSCKLLNFCFVSWHCLLGCLSFLCDLVQGGCLWMSLCSCCSGIIGIL